MRILGFLFLAACAGGSTGSTCPTSNAPTYGNFGQGFMVKYCTGCHSTEASDRHGAPSDVNLDTEADVLRHAAAIDEVSAMGPNARNTAMPDMSGPVHVEPTDEERQQLGQFLACEQMK